MKSDVKGGMFIFDYGCLEFSSNGLGVSAENTEDGNADFGVTTHPRSVVSRTAQIGEDYGHWRNPSIFASAGIEMLINKLVLPLKMRALGKLIGVRSGQ